MSKAIYLTNKQARVFMLLKQGLIGDLNFLANKELLILSVKRAVSILTLLIFAAKTPSLFCAPGSRALKSRCWTSFCIKIEYCLTILIKIFQLSRLPFRRYRQAYQNNIKSLDAVNAVCGKIKDIILERGAVSSSDIGFDGAVDWYWSQTRLSRAALETMYFRGDLVIWAKKGQSNITTLPKTILTPGC